MAGRAEGLSLTFTIEKGEDGYFIGYVEEFPGVASQGRTVPEVQQNLLEALFAALETFSQRDRRPTRRIVGKVVDSRKVELTAAIPS
jgi:predicted RNase H-like HicB family nuclease